MGKVCSKSQKGTNDATAFAKNRRSQSRRTSLGVGRCVSRARLFAASSRLQPRCRVSRAWAESPRQRGANDAREASTREGSSLCRIIIISLLLLSLLLFWLFSNWSYSSGAHYGRLSDFLAAILVVFTVVLKCTFGIACNMHFLCEAVDSP